MSVVPLNANDKAAVAIADVAVVRGALSKLNARVVPPWLPPAHLFQDGSVPTGAAAFAAVPSQDILEVIAVRGPLHAVDGWCYVARSLNALISGDPHAARHLAYYGELRAALSILASSGIGIFNRRNAVVDAAGDVHVLADRSTHDMCWAAIIEWASLPNSLDRLVEPLKFGSGSIMDPFREFFPGTMSAAAGYLMQEWGFDLELGASDRDERNWSSYQPTDFSPIVTTPAEDLTFLTMFWESLRPGGVTLERHLLRILLETQARVLGGTTVADYGVRYARLDEQLQSIVTFEFLTREQDPVDHDFLWKVSRTAVPAHPYSMICRAALLLRLATGMAEGNLRAASVQPAIHFDAWWKEFGIRHGLWSPPYEPANSQELWEDVSTALSDAALTQTDTRQQWISSLAGNAFRICETERVALWSLIQ